MTRFLKAHAHTYAFAAMQIETIRLSFIGSKLIDVFEHAALRAPLCTTEISGRYYIANYRVCR